MALPLSFRWDEEFIAQIDAARGDVPRSKFVRKAVEQALGHERVPDETATRAPSNRADPPAPAEQLSRADMFRRATQGQR